jgi:hypothetical protein
LGTDPPVAASSLDANGPCGGLTFALSTYSPPDQAPGTGQEAGGGGDGDAPPSVLLLEVIFDDAGALCRGCRLVGGGGQGEVFRVRHKDGASLDFVGPTVGALECAPGGPVGTVAGSRGSRPKLLPVNMH